MNFVRVGAGRVAPLFLALVLVLPVMASAQNLKVLDWNTHHGVGTDGAYDLQRFVTWIVRSGAQVVSLNEVEKNNSWGNEDQPARYAALLRAASGKPWYYTFARRDGDTGGQGNLILGAIPFEATGADVLSCSRWVARAQIVVDGVRLERLLHAPRCGFVDAPGHADERVERLGLGLLPAARHRRGLDAWPGATE